MQWNSHLPGKYISSYKRDKKKSFSEKKLVRENLSWKGSIITAEFQPLFSSKSSFSLLAGTVTATTIPGFSSPIIALALLDRLWAIPLFY